MKKTFPIHSIVCCRALSVLNMGSNISVSNSYRNDTFVGGLSCFFKRIDNIPKILFDCH